MLMPADENSKKRTAGGLFTLFARPAGSGFPKFVRPSPFLPLVKTSSNIYGWCTIWYDTMGVSYVCRGDYYVRFCVGDAGAEWLFVHVHVLYHRLGVKNY